MVAACISGWGAAAQSQGYTPLPVRAALQQALDSLPHYRCGTGEAACASASRSERNAPPLSQSVAMLVMQDGIASGMSMHCQMDWHRQQRPAMVAKWRMQVTAPRGLALAEALHDVVRDDVFAHLSHKGTCAPKIHAITRMHLDALAR